MSALKRGAQPRRTLDKHQDQINEINVSVERITNAQVPRPDVHNRVQASLLSARMKADLSGFRYAKDAGGGLQESVTWGDLAAVLGFDVVLNGLIDYICAGVEGTGLPVSERPAKIEELRNERRPLEIKEEREILKLQSSSYTIIRRADVDPEIVFCDEVFD